MFKTVRLMYSNGDVQVRNDQALKSRIHYLRDGRHSTTKKTKAEDKAFLMKGFHHHPYEARAFFMAGFMEKSFFSPKKDCPILKRIKPKRRKTEKLRDEFHYVFKDNQVLHYILFEMEQRRRSAMTQQEHNGIYYQAFDDSNDMIHIDMAIEAFKIRLKMCELNENEGIAQKRCYREIKELQEAGFMMSPAKSCSEYFINFAMYSSWLTTSKWSVINNNFDRNPYFLGIKEECDAYRIAPGKWIGPKGDLAGDHYMLVQNFSNHLYSMISSRSLKECRVMRLMEKPVYVSPKYLFKNEVFHQ